MINLNILPMKKFQLSCLFFFALIIQFSCNRESSIQFQSYWDQQPDRYWIGPEFWANSLQDWRIKNGRLECINSEHRMRTVHMLSRFLTEKPGNLNMEMYTGLVDEKSVLDAGHWCGFLIAAGDLEMDYRGRALVHRNHGKAAGYIAAVNGEGKIIFIDNETGDIINNEQESGSPVLFSGGRNVKLNLELVRAGEKYELIMSAMNQGNEISAKISISDVDRLTGNIAIVANGGGNTKEDSFWFSNWIINGSKLKLIQEQRFGPVLGVLYTISEGSLKMSVQMPPISPADAQEVILEVVDMETGEWKRVSSSQIIIPGYVAVFRLDAWNDSEAHDYRIVYPLYNENGVIKEYFYYGLIARDPIDKEEIVVAAFTGNSNSAGMGNGLVDFKNSLWFPHNDIANHVTKHNPDLLFYSGDNVYEGRPTPPDFSSEINTELDYLYKWYLFFWAHGVLTKSVPAVTIPDDHDVYHGNIWGAGGVQSQRRPENGIYPDHYKGFEGHWQQDQGGYKLSPRLVNMIQLTQTANLPDPYDPAPVGQDISVYFCDINYGRISFAVLEDRKFKSAPSRILTGKKVINGFSQIKGIDGRSLDHPDAILLGERQLAFIDDWAGDWKNTDMKVALSQSIFANLSTYPDTFITDAGTPRLEPLALGVIPKDYSKAKDMDSNGWPQTGRKKALRGLRKGYAFMIGGDQHLGSTIHHGIDDWEDAGYSLCVPSIANLWPRRWFPPSPGLNHQEGLPLYTGRYFDGFGNRVTVQAVSNPYISGEEPARLHDRAPGYGIVKLNKKTQLIKIECWPRYSDPESSEAEQYPGWPVTISMEDNYGRKAVAWLPVMRVTGLERPPVIHVKEEKTGEVVYTLRIRESVYQPKVFSYGTFTLTIGEPGTDNLKTISGIRSGSKEQLEEILINF